MTAGGVVWQLECQASNVTASVQKWPPSRLLHGHTLPVFFANDQSHRLPRSAELCSCRKPATRPYGGLVLDTYAPATLHRSLDAVIYRVQIRTVGWLHVRTDGLGVSRRWSSTVSRARCAGALSWWKTNTSPAMMRIAGSSSCISNTSRYYCSLIFAPC